MKKKKKDNKKTEETDDMIVFQKDTKPYEPKLKIESDLNSVLKVLVTNPNPLLVKREGNKKVKRKNS